MSIESEPERSIIELLDDRTHPIDQHTWVQFCYALWLHLRQPTLTVIDPRGILKQDKLRDLKLKPPPAEEFEGSQLLQKPSIDAHNKVVGLIRQFIQTIEKRTYWDRTSKEVLQRASKAVSVQQSLDPVDECFECVICRDSESKDRVSIEFHFQDSLFAVSPSYVVCSDHYYFLLAYSTVCRLSNCMQAALLGPEVKGVTMEEDFMARFEANQLAAKRETVNSMLKYIYLCSQGHL